MTGCGQPGPLAGRRVAVLETREAARLGRMFQERGAAIVSCRTVAIVDAVDSAPVYAWLRRFTADPPEYLILLTGEGLARLYRLARSAGIDSDFVAALAGTRTIARGPKPVRALRSLGLAPQLRAEQPTTDGVISLLSGLDLKGCRVGVQLYPQASSRLCDFLEGVGAQPDAVTPYDYAACEPDEALAEIIERIVAGEIDAIAFTSASQVRRLFDVARSRTAVGRLTVALGKCAVAAVGPVVAAELQRQGVVPTIVPADQYFMKPLVNVIAQALSHSA